MLIPCSTLRLFLARVGSICGRWLIQLQLTEQDCYHSLLLLSTSILLFGIVLLNSSSSIPVTVSIHHSYPKHHWSYIPKNVDTGIPLSLYDFFVTSFGIAVNPTTCNHLREATFYRRILHHNHLFSSTIPRVSISRCATFIHGLIRDYRPCTSRTPSSSLHFQLSLPFIQVSILLLKLLVWALGDCTPTPVFYRW